MSLADYTEANNFLDRNKIEFVSNDDALPESKEVDAYVKARLFPSFGTLVTTWSSAGPTFTPEIVRSIAGMLMAAYRYDKLYSEETEVQNAYAANLQARADDMLNKIIVGDLGLDDETYISSSEWVENDIWPNDTTVKTGTTDPDRFFTMDQIF